MPKRPGGWPRTIRSTPRRSRGSPRRFPTARAQAHDPAREEIDLLVQARTALKELQGRIDQQGEHRPPAIVAKAHGAVAKTLRAELRKIDAAIAAKIRANPASCRRAEIIASVPGLGDQAVAGVIAWMPELGRVSNEAAAALVGVAPYDDDSGERRGARCIKGGRRKLRNLLYMPVMGAADSAQPGAQGLLSTPARQGQGSQGRDHRLHAQADRHPQHHARAR